MIQEKSEKYKQDRECDHHIASDFVVESAYLHTVLLRMFAVAISAPELSMHE